MNYYNFMDKADLFFEEGLGGEILAILIGLVVIFFIAGELAKFFGRKR